MRPSHRHGRLTLVTPVADAPLSRPRRLWRALIAFWRRTDASNVGARPVDTDDFETAWALLRQDTADYSEKRRNA